MADKNLKDIKNIRNIKAVIIDKSVDPNVNNKNCVYEILVEYNDGSKQIFGADNYDDLQNRVYTTDMFADAVKENGLSINKSAAGYLEDSRNVQLYKVSDKEKMKEYDEASIIYEDGKSSVAKKVLITGGILAGAATLVTGGVVLAKNLNKKDVAPNDDNVELAVEEVEEIAKPDMEGQDWDYYLETAIDTTQKEAWSKVGDFLISFNNSQDWMERTNKDGELSRFGFTPEETMAFHLRFNDYTDEEIITICNGNNINADEIMNLSNDFIEKMNLYYSISSEKSGISALFNDEHDKEVIEAFEAHHSQMMNASDKEKKQLLKEEKQMYKDYFNSDIEGKETKARAASTSYLLRTMLPADGREANLRNYKGTIEIYKNGGSGSIEVKTDLFDEVFMCRYLSGFDNFDEEHFLKQLGYNSDKYYVGIDGEKSSIADLSCGEQEEKLRDADDFRVSLETSEQVINDNREAIKNEMSNLTVDENGHFDEADIDRILDSYQQESVDTRISELTKFTYDNELIASMLKQKLETLNKTELNSNTFWELYTEMAMKIEANLGNGKVSSSGKGQKIVETTNRNTAKDALIASGDTPQVAEAKIVAAEEAAAKAVGAERDTEETRQKHEQLAQQEQANLQKIYDDTFSYYANGGTGEYNANWAQGKQDASSSYNQSIKDTYSLGKQDGKANYDAKKKAEEENKNNTPSTPNVPDYVQPGTITTDPTGNDGTISDVINKSNGEDTNKDVPTPSPIPGPTEPSTPDTPSTPSENPSYAPIVDDPILPNSDTIYFDEDDIISQLDAMDSYADDLSITPVEEENTDSIVKTR